MHIQNKYQLVTNSHSTVSSARRLSVSSGMDMLTFSYLTLTECTKGAFLSQRVEGKLTVIGLMSSLQLSGQRSSSGMSGRATRTQSNCVIGDTTQTYSGRLAWCGCDRDCEAMGFSHLRAEHVPGQTPWWKKRGQGEERKEVRRGVFGV